MESALSDAGLAPHHLDVEITESTLLADIETATEALDRLRAMGVRVSVDDFGTGYSSLSYLKRLPIDSLKIDRVFVSDITDDGDGFAISAAIISLARALKLDVIAEGAETAQQVDSLRRLGCKKIQGFYFSKPLPPRLAEGFVERFMKQSALRSMTKDGRVIVAVDDDNPAAAPLSSGEREGELQPPRPAVGGHRRDPLDPPEAAPSRSNQPDRGSVPASERLTSQPSR